VHELATLLIEGRARLGLDQIELGRRVGVGQQTVSRWERGLSRPRREVAVAVANVLGLRGEEVLNAAGYIPAAADSLDEMSPSVRPRARTLPFHELSPERFEDVCVEILHNLHPGGHSSRYGGPGERQDGIDLLLDGVSGATAQCKRHKHFGPKDVQAAVNAVVHPAPRNYLFLARQTATAAARAEMARHETWELWDGEDLSRYVRTRMSQDEAVRFVDAHFPNHREPFLGVPQPGQWVSVKEFYAATSGTRLFTHDWTLAGRETQLTELQSALESDANHVALLFGRGGIGKSRLLRAIAEIFDEKGWEVRMLRAGSQLDPASFELLPPRNPLLLIVDDAHERTDIGQIVARASARNESARLLIACRPYGKPDLENELRRAGLDLSSLPTTNLGDLTQEAATALACEALGPNHAGVADRLAMLTRDCPLATAVGGYLIRTGALHPREIEQDNRIRTQILLGFRDALLAESAYGDREYRSVIDAISALQPLRTGVPEFREAFAELVGIPYSRIGHHLRSLEDAGVLMRRGDSLRIVPDLLGDVVLADACFDQRTGVDSGYLSEVLAAATDGALENAFINIARVDWQVGHVLRDSTEPFWNDIQQDLEKQEIETYLKILALLKRVASFQPSRAFNAIRWILDHPTEEAPSSIDTPWILRSRWRHVLDEIPAVLRAVAYTLEALPAACGALWELAQTDRRPTNQYPNHPLRVLRELAEYAPDKPLTYNEAILGLAESWANDNTELSPLKAIEGLVATEGSTQTYDNRTLSFRPFPIAQDKVWPIRRRAIDLALREIRSGDYQRGVAGAQYLQLALRYPTGSFSREVDHDERRSWDRDFMETIAALREVLRSVDLDPVVCVAILDTVHWHIGYGEGHTRDAAEAAIAVLPDTVSFDIALLLHDGSAALVRERGTDFEHYKLAVSSRLERISCRALNELNDAALVLLIEERLHREMLAFGGDALGAVQLLGALLKRRPPVAEAFVNRLFENTESVLQTVTSSFVSLVGRWQPDALMGTIHRLLEHASPLVRTEVAVGLAGRDRDARSLNDGELELLHQFASGREVRLRVALVDAARALAGTEPQVAGDLLVRISFSDSPIVAERLFMYLDWDGTNLAWTALNQEQQSTLLAELTNLPNIEDHWIMEFLRRRSAEDPRTVLGLLQRRIELAEGMASLGQFRPIPYQWHQPLTLREHPDFLLLLREHLTWLGEPSTWRRKHLAKGLFTAAAGSFDEPVLSLLYEIVRTGNEADARTVAGVLEEAPNDLVFNYVSFVSDVLATAARFGPETLKAMCTSLYISATTGMRQGAYGEPFAEDIRLRDQCAEIADALSEASIAADLYRELSRYGAEAVKQETLRDSTDHRAW
jgi:transcriptional regulator with XRE-family HTH domain/DNA-binding transcriptional ArsR family regulator